MKTEELIMARIRNQLRIHWNWLKNKDADEVGDFIESWIKQAMKKK
jgi:hypothetical protein